MSISYLGLLRKAVQCFNFPQNLFFWGGKPYGIKISRNVMSPVAIHKYISLTQNLPQYLLAKIL